MHGLFKQGQIVWATKETAGRLDPVSAMPPAPSKDQIDFMDHWYPIQVRYRDRPPA
jgi:hypothetical protein